MEDEKCEKYIKKISLKTCDRKRPFRRSVCG
jgi:hypothetical protein